MTKRGEIAHRRAEMKARLMARMLNRTTSRKATGINGLAKALAAKAAGEVVADPELDHNQPSSDDTSSDDTSSDDTSSDDTST